MQPRDRRRQPAAPVLAMLAAQACGGVPVPLYQDAVGRRDGLHAERRRDRVRDRRGPGAGRQAARGAGAAVAARIAPHRLRRPARHCATTSSRACIGYDELRELGRAFDARAPRLLRRSRSASGEPGDVARDALHLGHHRQAQGRVPDARRVHRGRPRRRRVRPARARRRHPVATCRWRGSATTCSRWRNGWSPASRSTARSRARR